FRAPLDAHRRRYGPRHPQGVGGRRRARGDPFRALAAISGNGSSAFDRRHAPDRLRGHPSAVEPSARTGGTPVLIARAPLRISLAGGGTDFESYYSKYGGVAVTAT